jgi:hypothetical protein
MIERVLIQKQDGEFVSANGYCAWRGFRERGLGIQFFEWPAMREGDVPLSRDVMVVGGVGAVRFALKRLGVDVPVGIDLPDSLAAYRGRRVWRSTWDEVRTHIDRNLSPIFVKPLDRPKAFRGQVLRSFADLIPTAALPDEMNVLVSEPVEFRSEWRFFVVGGEVVGSGHHSGDPLVFPDRAVVAAAVKDFAGEAPAGYGIDFGVTTDGRTLLVEVNDGYSLGCLGLRSDLYVGLLEARWQELVSRL